MFLPVEKAVNLEVAIFAEKNFVRNSGIFWVIQMGSGWTIDRNRHQKFVQVWRRQVRRNRGLSVQKVAHAIQSKRYNLVGEMLGRVQRYK